MRPPLQMATYFKYVPISVNQVFPFFLAAKKIIGKFKDIEIDICPWLFLTVSLQMRRGNYEMH